MKFTQPFRGFSLIELLIVIAILAVIAIIVLPNLLSGSRQADVSGATQQIVSSLRLAESQSAQQVQGLQWGVHFSNTTNTAPFYAVFSGPSYASGTVQNVYRLPSSVGFVSSNLPVGSTLDITFSPVSGSIPIPAQVKLYSISQPSVSSTISILATGEVMVGGPSLADIYVVDYGNNRIEKFDLNGIYLSQFGSYGSGDYSEGLFNDPRGIALDSGGNIYVVDSSNERVEKFNSSGVYLSEFATSTTIAGIAVDPADNIYVAASSGIEKFNSSGVYLSELPITAGFGIAMDSAGNIYVPQGFHVAKFNSAGTYLSQFGTFGSGNGQFNNLAGIALDSSGNIYVVDEGNNRIEKFNSAGTYLSQFGTFGSGNGQFNVPSGIALDSSGNVYVVDGGNNRVEEFNAANVYLSQFGTFGSGNGQFSSPYGIAVR